MNPAAVMTAALFDTGGGRLVVELGHDFFDSYGIQVVRLVASLQNLS